jgi:hypothetical protein
MRPLDLFIEKQACDRSMDAGASRALSREVDDLCQKEGLDRKQILSGQDKLGLTAAGLLVGSPFMLFGLGVTFAMFDEMDFRRDLRAREELLARRNPLRKGDDDDETKKDKLKPFKPEISASLLAMDLQSGKTLRDKQVKRPKSDQAVFSDSKRNKPFLSASHDWLKVNKLAKRKQFLLEEIERVNKGQQLSLVSNLLTQIEVLDKALKRLGS